jgi:anti-sigma factor RsiW
MKGAVMKEKRQEDRHVCSQPKLVYLFPLYLIGDGTPDQRRMIEKHLETCTACRRDMRLFSDLQRVGEEIFGDH